MGRRPIMSTARVALLAARPLIKLASRLTAPSSSLTPLSGLPISLGKSSDRTFTPLHVGQNSSVFLILSRSPTLDPPNR
ncbi:hypothetical protein HanPI659440_Chr01g0011141 [Helianthus annuus]|nr:hypothetical protein HanPI659440_Chr01g0011141 [Helianthus annuus]